MAIRVTPGKIRPSNGGVTSSFSTKKGFKREPQSNTQQKTLHYWFYFSTVMSQYTAWVIKIKRSSLIYSFADKKMTAIKFWIKFVKTFSRKIWKPSLIPLKLNRSKRTFALTAIKWKSLMQLTSILIFEEDEYVHRTNFCYLNNEF